MKSTVTAIISASSRGYAQYDPESQIDDLDIDWDDLGIHEPILAAIDATVLGVQTRVDCLKGAHDLARSYSSKANHRLAKMMRFAVHQGKLSLRGWDIKPLDAAARLARTPPRGPVGRGQWWSR